MGRVDFVSPEAAADEQLMLTGETNLVSFTSLHARQQLTQV